MKSLVSSVFWHIITGLKGLQWKQAIFALVLALLGQAGIQNFREIPVTLHSLLTADYSADAIHIRFPNLQDTILLEALGDHASDQAMSAYATLQSNLLTPVPTVTLRPGEIPQIPPSATPSPIVTITVDTASPTPTSSPTPSPTPTIWGTPTNQPLYTAQPTLNPALTPTRVKPTRVRPTNTKPPKATATAAMAPTATRKPPTPTKAATSTKPPRPYPAPTKPPYP